MLIMLCSFAWYLLLIYIYINFIDDINNFIIHLFSFKMSRFINLLNKM